MRAAAISIGVGLLSGAALAGPVAGPDETCMPRVGQLVPLAEPLVAQLGVLDITFDPERYDAEFRGCGLDGGATCELSLHKRVQRDGDWITAPFEERGFGESVSVPHDMLETTVRLPLCAAPAPEPPPVKKPPKPVKKPRRVPRPPPPPEPAPVVPQHDPNADPEAIARARVVGAPGVEALIEGAWQPGITFAPSTPAPLPMFVVPDPGQRLRIDARVEVEVAADGTVTFHKSNASVPVDGAWMPPTTSGPDDDRGHRSAAERMMAGQQVAGVGATARGEGLNALDGIDIDAPIKRAYMEATREARMAMYAEQREKTMNLAIFRLEDQLVAVRDSAAAEAEKAAAVFTLWSQMTNETEAALDGRHTSAGAEARDHVEGFVRRAWQSPPPGFDRAALVELHRANGWVPGKPVFDPYSVGVAEILSPIDGQAITVDAGTAP